MLFLLCTSHTSAPSSADKNGLGNFKNEWCGWMDSQVKSTEKADEKWNRSLRLLQSFILCSSPTPLMPASRQVNKQKWVSERETMRSETEDEWKFKMKRNWKHIIVVYFHCYLVSCNIRQSPIKIGGYFQIDCQSINPSHSELKVLCIYIAVL